MNYAEDADDGRARARARPPTRADIFEVRGWTRARARHASCRSPLRPDRVTFRYDGLDGVAHGGRTSRSPRPAAELGPVEPGRRGPRHRAAGSGSLWRWPLAPGEARELALDRLDHGAPVAAATAHAPAGRSGVRRDAVPAAAARGRGRPWPAAYHAWSRGIAEVATDNELFNLAVAALRRPTCGCSINDGPRRGRALRRRRRAVVHDAVRARLAHHRAPGARRSGRSSPSRRSRCSPRYQATEDDPGATRSRARSSTSCGPARWPGPASCRTRPYYGTRRRDAAVADPPRRDVRLDRRPGARRPPVAERARARSTGSTATATATATASSSTSGARERGLLNQGWKDSRDAIRDRHGPRGASPRSPSPRSRATSSTRSAGWPASPACAARQTLAARLEREAETLRGRFEDAFWVEDQGFYAMALDGEKRRADAIGSNAGHCLWSGIVSPERAGGVVDRLIGAGHVLGLGDPDVRRRPARLQPDRLPHRARSGRTTRRSSPRASSATASTTRRTGWSATSSRRAQHFADVPAAGAVLRLRPRRLAGARAVPGRLLAAGLGGRRRSFLFLETMLGLRPHADRRRAGARAPAPAGLARPRSPSRTCASARATVDLLFHRWRGDDVRRGPAQGRRPLRHDPAVAPVPPDAFTVAELVHARHRTPCAHRVRSRRASTRSCSWRSALGVRPGRRSSPTRRRSSGDGAREAFEAAVARRELPASPSPTSGASGVPRARLRDRRPGADPAPGDGAPRRRRRAEEIAARLSHAPRAPGLAAKLRVADVGTGSGRDRHRRSWPRSGAAGWTRRSSSSRSTCRRTRSSSPARTRWATASRTGWCSSPPTCCPYHVEPPYTVVCANLPYVPTGGAPDPRARPVVRAGARARRRTGRAGRRPAAPRLLPAHARAATAIALLEIGANQGRRSRTRSPLRLPGLAVPGRERPRRPATRSRGSSPRHPLA